MGRALLIALVVSAIGCTRPASVTRCSPSSPCPAGGACVDGVCFAAPDASACADCDCTRDEECRSTIATCAATCESRHCVNRPDDARCAADEICDPIRSCVPRSDGGALDGSIDATIDAGRDAGPADAPIDVPRDARPTQLGDPCRLDADCPSPAGGASPRCLTSTSGTTFPGGYCSATCDILSTDCGPDGLCTIVGGSPTCLRRCSTVRDCRDPDYGCGQVGVFPSGDTCAPPSLL